jgi:CubicO group peptidase (beta-lactamase class C family)
MKKIQQLSLGFILILFVYSSIFAQSLPRSTPEREGVSSLAIEQFIQSFDPAKHELHSVMIVRHGKVIAESWWNPYSSDKKHSMYSVSKSWTSTAVGFAMDEKLFGLDDKVIDFFPEHKDLSQNKYVSDLTIRSLLTMSAGHKVEPLRGVVASTDDWIKGFLTAPIENKPGTKFLYNTLATYMLSAIVQKTSRKTVIDFLQSRLLSPLGIKDIDFETDPKGINTGGWGIRVHTEDMAKLGQLYLQKGNWNGKQILSKNWVNMATSKQIEQDPTASQAKKDSSDWLQGYGFQFWRCRNNGFRADGAYGQYIVVLPEKDAVVVITSESLDLQDDLNMIWKHLLPAFQEKPLVNNEKARKHLTNILKNNKIKFPTSNSQVGELDLFLHPFEFNKNSFNFKEISFEKTKKGLLMNIQLEDKSKHSIALKENTLEAGETTLPGPYLLRAARNAQANLAPFKTAAAYHWNPKNELNLTIRYTENPHHWNWSIIREGNSLQIKLINSFDPKNILSLKANLMP